VVITAQNLGLAEGLPLRSRDLTVDVKKKHLTISLKGKEALIDAELHKDVKTGDVIWCVYVWAGGGWVCMCTCEAFMDVQLRTHLTISAVFRCVSLCVYFVRVCVR